MKKMKKFLVIISVFIIVLFMLSSKIFAENNNINPTASPNIRRRLIRESSLTPLNNGYMRVFYDATNDNIGIEYYDKSFKILKKNKINLELDYYGGFYAGNDAYYIVEGQSNKDEKDDLEIIRVIKYDTNWKRLGAAKITSNATMFGGEVRYPFDVGNVEMTEVNGKLYIVTGHEGYIDTNIGQGHQGFLMIEVDKQTLTGKIVDADYSHSFAQYIDNKDQYIYVLEQSEGGRCTSLTRYEKSNLSKRTYIPVLKYGGKRTSMWAVPCYASVNGIATSQNNVLGIGTSIDQSQYDSVSSSTPYNIYLTVTPTNNFSENATKLKWITDYKNTSKSFTGLELTKINDNRFMISWEEFKEEQEIIDNDTLSYGKVHYLFIDGNGDKISKEYIASASLSDCKHIVKDNKIIYYASHANMVDFYTIDATNGNFNKVMYRVAGENATWDLDENGVLTISGQGAISINPEAIIKAPLSSSGGYSYSSYDNAWKYIRNKVKKIDIKEGIVSIPDEEFVGFSNLNEVNLPDSLKTIGKSVFRGSRYLRKVYLSKNITNIGEDAFWSGYYYTADDSKAYYVTVYTTKDSYVASWAAKNNITCVYVDNLVLNDSATSTTLKVVGESTTKMSVNSLQNDNNDYINMKKSVADKCVLSAYEVSTSDGNCFGNKELTFLVGKSFNGKKVKIVQKYSDGDVKIIDKTVDANGKVTINTDELSSYMIAIDIKDLDYLLGDVNGDKKVNIKDWNMMYEYISGKRKLTEYQMLCADVNKDKKVNIKDWNRLYEHISRINPLF